MGNHILDTIVIVILVIINATISFIQERNTQKSIEALLDMSAPKTKVLRDRKWIELYSKSIVPGDIVQIAAGDVIAADMRILKATDLQIDESALTGESEAVSKNQKN